MTATGGAVNLDGPLTSLPLKLADLHRSRPVGQRLTVTMPPDIAGDHRLGDVIAGAGFAPAADHEPDEAGATTTGLTRCDTLADTVGPSMTVLICGLNPSLYSAETGIGFARPGNRFWPAALASGLVSRDRDPIDALRSHGVGMTDLVKRPTRQASELSGDEYRNGLERVERLVDWLQPRLICFVGLAGWRTAVQRSAVAGLQRSRLAGRPVYLMPSTSGLNAHARLEDLGAHLTTAGELAGRSWPAGSQPDHLTAE